MRCPKCGFNSFDYLDACKKCGKDLSEYKSRFGIKSVLLTSLAAKAVEPETPDEPVAEETFEFVEPPAQEEAPAATPVAEEATDDRKTNDLDFDFMGSEEEKESLDFDELFEENLSDEEDDFFAPDDKDEEDDDKNALSLEQPDLGLDEAREPEDMTSETTELGLDDSDFAEFDKDDFEGDKGAPDHPFGGKGAFPTEGSPISRTQPVPAETQTTEESAAPPVASQPPVDDDAQEELFVFDDELLPPLPDTRLAEQTVDAFANTGAERSIDRTATGESDDFSLGALPAADLDRDPPSPKDTVVPPKAPEPPAPDHGASQPATAEQATASADRPPSFGRRVSAFLYDSVLLALTGLCFIVVAEAALLGTPGSIFPTLETLIDLSIPYFLVVFSVTFCYFTLFHFLTGQTPGKMLTDVRVETTTGEAITFSQAFIRSVGGLIQILPAGLGYLSSLGKSGRGWNDRLAGTRLTDLRLSVKSMNGEPRGDSGRGGTLEEAKEF